MSLIGSDLKNVIIVDEPQTLKIIKKMVFLINLFMDIVSIMILKRNKESCNINGDIRKSIRKKNHEIFTNITTALIVKTNYNLY